MCDTLAGGDISSYPDIICVPVNLLLINFMRYMYLNGTILSIKICTNVQHLHTTAHLLYTSVIMDFRHRSVLLFTVETNLGSVEAQ